jgi:hypothetical protein
MILKGRCTEISLVYFFILILQKNNPISLVVLFDIDPNHKFIYFGSIGVRNSGRIVKFFVGSTF